MEDIAAASLKTMSYGEKVHTSDGGL